MLTWIKNTLLKSQGSIARGKRFIIRIIHTTNLPAILPYEASAWGGQATSRVRGTG